MAFWSDISTEPKRQFNWLLFMGGIPQWIAKTAKKPQFTVNKAEHWYVNHKFNFPGRVEWAPINITLVDPVDPDASATILNILRAAGYTYPRNPNDTTTISRAKAISALGRVSLVQIGHDNNVFTEEWKFVNAWVSDCDFGELSYESDDLTELTVELTYDFAELVKSGIPVPINSILSPTTNL